MPECGTQELTDEDRSYAGSTYREVVDALRANPYQRVWGGTSESPLPVYEVRLGRLFRGAFVTSAARTLDFAMTKASNVSCGT